MMQEDYTSFIRRIRRLSKRKKTEIKMKKKRKRRKKRIMKRGRIEMNEINITLKREDLMRRAASALPRNLITGGNREVVNWINGVNEKRIGTVTETKTVAIDLETVTETVTVTTQGITVARGEIGITVLAQESSKKVGIHKITTRGMEAEAVAVGYIIVIAIKCMATGVEEGSGGDGHTTPNIPTMALQVVPTVQHTTLLIPRVLVITARRLLKGLKCLTGRHHLVYTGKIGAKRRDLIGQTDRSKSGEKIGLIGLPPIKKTTHRCMVYLCDENILII
ncbi:hypothetical protein GWK47_033361 [Chionoecetes opilio]|uniref:Uncharacterized protein n=1 Tax=Chionoecetes opilio TaxID=41210 RepID=A0A8J5D3E1_CHIOP|nr:hypothetical protein GWK47_033361 [Chionoecetes opilio]